MRDAFSYSLLLVALIGCAGAPDNGDPVLATQNGKTLTTSSYFRYLYRDLAGAEPTDTQVNGAMSQFRAGTPLSDIVRAQIQSDPHLRAFTSKLGGDLDSGVKPNPPGSRGFTSNDFLLYYLLLNGNRSSSTLNYALPFLLNSRQYLTYLIYSYL